MNLLSISHTESERRLHRILYFIKYGRMIYLHLALIIVASVLNLTLGIRGLYPAADDQIESMRAFGHQAAEQGVLIGYCVMSAIQFLFALAAVSACYFAVVRVWKLPLKMLSVAAWLITLIYPLVVWVLWQATSQIASPSFKLLHLLNSVILFALITDLAIALWYVSTAPEKASFTALLDPRLSKRFMTKVNRLLDFPRSPFLNWSSFAAYLLAILSACLLLRSISCIVSVDQFTLKYNWLLKAVGTKPAEELRRYSADLAYGMLGHLALAGVGFFLASTLQTTARKISSKNVDQVLKSSEGRYVLYLRPFDLDSDKLDKPSLPLISRLLCFQPFSVFVEEELFDVTDGYLPLIAVGKPKKKLPEDEQLPKNEPHRSNIVPRDIPDEEWQEYVKVGLTNKPANIKDGWTKEVIDVVGRLTDKKVESIVLVIKKTKKEGVLWEMRAILEAGKAPQTLFMFDPSAKDPAVWRDILDSVKPDFVKAGLLPPDFTFQGQPLAFYFAADIVVQIENANWSATSYRTAFASYLASREAPPALPAIQT